ncbi:hypothetical protein CLCR_01580 [Cladophialophora carrionii]|uniref:Plastocyanin-like domain-containing protein n=1 Tax=Cladophialophora carrionii TaxID=86049 RepID=A0A1C1CAJ1_9EURO|nr:hypothetical protein CLCR_01580 [Cladophialophora carrionii]
MRSFIFVAAAAAGLANAHESATWTSDVTVTATSTRTHTFCPVTQATTCDAADATDVSGNHGHHDGIGASNAQDAWWSIWQSAKTNYGVWDDWNTASETASATASATTTDTGSGNGGHGSGPSSSYSYSTSGSGSGPSSSYSHSYTASSSTSASATSTTSAAGCPTYTPAHNETYDYCNSAYDRSKWCDEKSIKTDYYTNDYDTGVTREYTLEITNTTLVYDGTGPKLALAVNGQVPGPVIEANWGDTVKVTVINKLQDNSTSIHFHGIRQFGTNDQDGVPGVTECGIAGNGGSRTYTWKATSYGTSWYHSHTFAQYGDGIRGPIVIHGPATANYDYDMGTVMIDDTYTNTAAAQAAVIAHFGPGGSFNTLFNGKNKNPDPVGPGGAPFSWGLKPCRKHLFRIINRLVLSSPGEIIIWLTVM